MTIPHGKTPREVLRYIERESRARRPAKTSGSVDVKQAIADLCHAGMASASGQDALEKWKSDNPRAARSVAQAKIDADADPRRVERTWPGGISEEHHKWMSQLHEGESNEERYDRLRSMWAERGRVVGTQTLPPDTGRRSYSYSERRFSVLHESVDKIAQAVSALNELRSTCHDAGLVGEFEKATKRLCADVAAEIVAARIDMEHWAQTGEERSPELGGGHE